MKGRVLQGTTSGRRRTPLEDAYDQFRLERQGSRLVVLDEASMCGSRKLARLLDHAAASRSKLVLVGDTKQLSSVDAGGGFRGLVARLAPTGCWRTGARSRVGSVTPCGTCARAACAPR